MGHEEPRRPQDSRAHTPLIADAAVRGQGLRPHAAIGFEDEPLEQRIGATELIREIHIAVANAAILGPVGSIETVPHDEWMRTVQVNLGGTVAIIRAVLPSMMKQSYGRVLTLSGGGVGGPHVPGASGRPLPHLAVTIRGDDGMEVPAGESGEVCVGPAAGDDRYRLMLGYWERSDATAAALAGGVLHTGDIGFVDSDRVLHLRFRVRR